MYMGNTPYRARGGYSMHVGDNRQLTGPPRHPYSGHMPTPSVAQGRYDMGERSCRQPYEPPRENHSPMATTWTPRLGTPSTTNVMLATQGSPQPPPQPVDDPFQYRGPEPRVIAENDEYFRNKYYGLSHAGSYGSGPASMRYDSANPPIRSILKNKSSDPQDGMSNFNAGDEQNSYMNDRQLVPAPVPLPVVPSSGFGNVDEEDEFLYGSRRQEEALPVQVQHQQQQQQQQQQPPPPPPPSMPPMSAPERERVDRQWEQRPPSMDPYTNRRSQWSDDEDGIISFATSRPRYDIPDRTISPIHLSAPSIQPNVIDKPDFAAKSASSSSYDDRYQEPTHHYPADSNRCGRSDDHRSDYTAQRRSRSPPQPPPSKSPLREYRRRSRSPSPIRRRSRSRSPPVRSRSRTPESSQRKYRRIDSPPRELSPRKREADEEAARFGIEDRMSSFADSRRAGFDGRSGSGQPMAGIVDHPDYGMSDRYNHSQNYSSANRYGSSSNASAVRQLPKIPKVDKPIGSSAPSSSADGNAEGNAELTELNEKRNQFDSRLRSLKSLLEKTIKREGDLLRNKTRKDGFRDPQILENQKLQADVRKKIEDVHNALTDVEKQIFRITGKGNKDKGDEKKDVPSSVAGASALGMPTPKDDDDEDEVNYRFEYFDPGSHWCTQCDDLLPKMKNYFDHLHTSDHWKKVDLENQPWKPKVPKPKPTIENPVQAPVKGVQFLIPVKGFYCNLCAIFLGNPAHAEEHLKTPKHNRAYTRFTLLNPNYEHKWNSDKGKALLRQQKEERKRQKEEQEKEEREREARRRKHEEEIRKKDKALNEKIREENRNSKRVKELDEDVMSGRSEAVSVSKVKMNLLDKNKTQPKYGYSGKYNKYKDKGKESEKENERRSRKSSSVESSPSSSRASSPTGCAFGPNFPFNDRKLIMKTVVMISQKDINRAFRARLKQTLPPADGSRPPPVSSTDDAAAAVTAAENASSISNVLFPATDSTDDFELDNDIFASIKQKVADFDTKEDNFVLATVDPLSTEEGSEENKSEEEPRAGTDTNPDADTHSCSHRHDESEQADEGAASNEDHSPGERDENEVASDCPEAVEDEGPREESPRESLSESKGEEKEEAMPTPDVTLQTGEESPRMEIDTSFETSFNVDLSVKNDLNALEPVTSVSLHDDDEENKDEKKLDPIFPTLDLNDLAKSPPYTENFSNSDDLLQNMDYN